MNLPSAFRRCARHLGVAGVMAASLLTVSCGGSTQVVAFRPARLFGLGDEAMMLVDDGTRDAYKYSINDRTASGGGNCNLLPTFLQMAAAAKGMTFAACNPNSATPDAFTLASYGARVQDLTTQIGAIEGGLSASDVVVLYIGTHDVVDLWRQVSGGRLTLDGALEEARSRGREAAGRTNDMLATGARLVLVTVPNIGTSPWGRNEEQISAGAAEAIRRIGYEFNAELRVGIDAQRYDGRHYGLVPADDTVATIVAFPAQQLAPPANATDAACDPLIVQQLTQCTTNTLQAGASANSNLWADALHFGPVAHQRIGQQVQMRLLSNPF